MTKQTVLILGASGKFGRNCTEAFAAAGWQVRRFRRDTDDLMQAAQGVDVIVNGWNPPGYHLWEEALLPAHERVIAAARASGAHVIVPGNVYVYGPDAPRGWHAGTPQMATNPLARLRIRMEEMYRSSGVPTILIRAGDFIDTQASGNWFDIFIAPKAGKGIMTCPGDPDAPHAWAYLPDLARAAVALTERRDTLAIYEDVPFPGYTLTGRDMAAAMARALGHDVAVRRMSWLKLQVARPFMPLLKGVFEMRYLWDLPHHLDGSRFAALCPGFRATPVDMAMAAALAGIGTSPAAQLAAA